MENPIESPAERTERYFQEVKLAKSDDERQHIALTYQTYYAQLTADKQIESDKVHKVHFDRLKQELDDFEPTLQRVKELLKQAFEKKGQKPT